MSIRIGRVGIGALTLNDPTSVQFGGGTLELRGVQQCATIGEAHLLRWCIEHLADGDEPVVPISFGTDATHADSDLDGYYRVLSCSVDGDPGEMGLGWVPWSARFARLRSPKVQPTELAVSTALRKNAHGITSTTLNGANRGGVYMALPDYSPEWSPLFGSVVRTADSGAVRCYYGSAGTFAAGINYATARYFATPQGAVVEPYAGAATIEHSVGGNWIPTTGRYIVNSSPLVRMTNGLVRVGWSSSPTGRFEVSWYNGSSWSAVKTFHVWIGVGTVGTVWSQIATVNEIMVLRNTPEHCALRLVVADPTTLGRSTRIIDVALSRGARRVELRLGDCQADHVRLGRATAEAATALTAGIRATSNDAACNRYVLTGDNFTTNDITNGYISSAFNSAYPHVAAIGAEVGGTGATEPNRAQDEIDAFYTVASARAEWPLEG